MSTTHQQITEAERIFEYNSQDSRDNFINLLKSYQGDKIDFDGLGGLPAFHLNVQNELVLLLHHAPNLTKLSLAGCWNITDDGLKGLSEGLTELNLTCCCNITDNVLKDLQKGLTTLNLTFCHNITDNGLKDLPEGLTELGLIGCHNITDDGLRHFLENNTSITNIILPNHLQNNDIAEKVRKVTERNKELNKKERISAANAAPGVFLDYVIPNGKTSLADVGLVLAGFMGMVGATKLREVTTKTNAAYVGAYEKEKNRQINTRGQSHRVAN